MVSNSSQPIVGYYRNFGSAWGALAGTTGIYGILSALLPANASYGFPPMGDATMISLAGFVLMFAAMTFLAFHVHVERLRRSLIIALILIAFPSLAAYIVCYWKFVRKVDIPSISSSTSLSVGYERTAFAKANFKGDSDWEMLRQRGPDEEEIWNLWTSKSIVVARLLLLSTFFLFTMSLVLAFSLGVRNLTATTENG